MTLVEQDEDTRWLAWIKKQFEGIAGDDQQIHLAEFKGAIKAKEPFFVERIFALLDADGSGTIDLDELMEGMTKLTKGDQMDKLRFLFDIFDVDGVGTIDPEELKTVLRSCMNESSMKLSEESLHALTMALFESADDDDSGEITFEELVGELSKHPGVMDNLTISTSHWLRPPEQEKVKKKPGCSRYFTKRYLQNNTRKVIFLLVYFIINIGLFILSAYRYRKFNWAVIIARGMGMDLNFNCSFIVVLMLRRFLSWLRTTTLGNYLPMDQSILIHKLVGFMIAFQVTVHTVAHLINIRECSAVANPSKLWLFTLQSRIGYIGPGFGYLSGVILDVILFIMVICSLGFIRRGGHFKVFYWTHQLCLLFWIFLIMHGPIFWCFFLVPGLFYLLERVLGSRLMKLYRWGRIYATRVHLLPSRVTQLVITKPPNFRYRPGDYIFLNIPDIAANEWHPFTISSCPEMEDEIWVHIRSAGHWTGKVYDLFESLEEVSDFDDIEKGRDFINKGKRFTRDFYEPALHTKSTNSLVFVDGPYGTSSREIFDSDHAVLIASGIGVTPYASILQSIMHRYTMSKLTCPNCHKDWYCDRMDRKMKLKQVDFIWINRSQNSFEWFVRLLAQLEMQQLDAGTEDFLQMQMYMTSAMAKNDVKGLGLQMAMEILHKKDNKDVMTGLKTRTQAGRPDWPQVFSKIADANKGRVKVFFCGAPSLAKSIKGHCEKVGFTFSKENF
ncbi:hypothetical protein CAPTEDRAFT_147619 [Capitella teleta]|uniref:NADPH oxidase 5 n=1 Tax=Capitella teleta TaxID=283909 RepID=R7UMD4_CAPTE|nr:hypothetical protein CAPTEDRAFT_147619 [Capitella teleta]|eukprot:ELU05067.1 hypothetical protein CAPTEDRAFT_147619 [Capitella teleta]